MLGGWAENAFKIELISTISIPQIFIEAYYMPGTNLSRLSGEEDDLSRLSGVFTELLYWRKRGCKQLTTLQYTTVERGKLGVQFGL